MPHSDLATREKRIEALRSQRRRQLRRRRGAAVLILGTVIAALVLLAGDLLSTTPVSRQLHGNTGASATTAPTKHDDPGRRLRAASAVHANTFSVGMTTLHLTDTTRTVTLPSGTVVPRPVTTVVRYPSLDRGSGFTAGTRAPARADGPFPLIVFGHGFNLMPGAYARLLEYWTSAGFIVAAPIFPLENPDADGGHPNESDLPNQPQDMRFVISQLLQLSARRSGPLSGLINKHEIAVAGHSDGGDTALALAYDPTLRDPHLQAAVILSGAEIPMRPAFQIASGGPPLLATQGTADTINLPSATAAFFTTAPPPKYLLQLLGGSHLGPYATDPAELRVTERVTTAFLQYYLYHDHAARRTLLRAGNVPGTATLQASP